MELTKSIIRADIIAAKQAIEYFDQKGTKEIKILLLTICSRRQRN